MKIRIPTIEPRDYQVPFLKAFDSGIQYSVITWHRRAGKDVKRCGIIFVSGQGA
jgi:hypothetical protein